MAGGCSPGSPVNQTQEQAFSIFVFRGNGSPVSVTRHPVNEAGNGKERRSSSSCPHGYRKRPRGTHMRYESHCGDIVSKTRQVLLYWTLKHSALDTLPEILSLQTNMGDIESRENVSIQNSLGTIRTLTHCDGDNVLTRADVYKSAVCFFCVFFKQCKKINLIQQSKSRFWVFFLLFFSWSLV